MSSFFHFTTFTNHHLFVLLCFLCKSQHHGLFFMFTWIAHSAWLYYMWVTASTGIIKSWYIVSRVSGISDMFLLLYHYSILRYFNVKVYHYPYFLSIALSIHLLIYTIMSRKAIHCSVFYIALLACGCLFCY